MTDLSAAREHMVARQIRPNHVNDLDVLQAMLDVPREEFVPDRLKSIAYIDEDLDIGNDRWMMEPVVLARLIQAAEVDDDDVALVVGCAAGYSAAVLARLASTVVALEQDEKLADAAAENLSRLGVDNAAVVRGRLVEGYADQGPYDVILIDGAIERMPEQILDQLAPGGRLVTVDDVIDPGRAVLYERHEDDVIGHRTLFDAAIQVLPGFEAPKTFNF